MLVGQKVKLLRAALHYNQKGLAESCKMSQTTLSNLETGKLKRELPEDKKQRLAAALGVSVDELETTDLADLFVSNNQKNGTSNVANLYQMADDQAMQASQQLIASQEARITHLETQISQLMAILSRTVSGIST
jgi:transcriptional regulator with XRE-family HTH domain